LSPNRIYSVKYTGNSNNTNSILDTIWEVNFYENSEQITINLEVVQNIVGKSTAWGIYGTSVVQSLKFPENALGYKFISWKVQSNPSPTVGTTDSGYSSRI
jgi:hypothetical protein